MSVGHVDFGLAPPYDLEGVFFLLKLNAGFTALCTEDTVVVAVDMTACCRDACAFMAPWPSARLIKAAAASPTDVICFVISF